MTSRSHSVSSGNIYADLGFEDADEMQIKSVLARQILYDMEDRGLNQQQLAELLGIDQPKVSAIVRGRLRDFSTDRLRNFVTRLGHDVTIVVHPPDSAHRGRTRIEASLEPIAASYPICEQVRLD